ncbi:recombinase family protein [Lacibacter sp. MH-610]|uniref:recombinase family protein n=1 Tax=Lacibacter sp. MH-610 TaxID=3020883 RepID=UPI003892C435
MIRFAFTYERLSDEGAIDTQTKLIEEYCSRNNIIIKASFTDDGVSGATFKRKGWLQLEAALKKQHKEIDFIVMRDTTRFGRTDFIESMMKRTYIQNQYGVKILNLDDNPEVNVNDLMVRLKQTFESFYAQKQREDTRDWIIQRQTSMKRQGYYPHRAPLGYMNAKDDKKNGVICIDQEKAPVIAEMFKLFVSGKGQMELKEWLKTKGIQVKGRSTVTRMLQNPIYAGYIMVPPTTKSQGFIEKGRHEPLIPKPLFDAVQVRLKRKKPVRHADDEVYLRGVLYSEFGNKLSSSRSRGKMGKLYNYYIDPKHGINLNADKLHAQFDAILEVCTFEREEAEWMKSQVLATVLQEIEDGTKKADGIKKDIALLNTRIAEVQKKYLTTEGVSVDVYKETMAEFNSRKSALEHELSSYQLSRSYYIEVVNDVFNSLTNLKQVFHQIPVERKHDFVNLIFGGFLYYSHNCFRTPYLSELIASKELILKEKGLLIVEQPFVRLESKSPMYHVRDSNP